MVHNEGMVRLLDACMTAFPVADITSDGNCPCFYPWVKAYGAHLHLRVTEESKPRSKRLYHTHMMQKNKNDLRHEFKLKKEQFLKTADPHALGQSFFQSLLEIFEIEEINPPASVALYWAKGDEVPTQFLIKVLFEKGFQVLLPKLRNDQTPISNEPTMDFYPYEPGDSLSAGAFGLMEPNPSTSMIPDVMLLPLLGYNDQGHRLGYGKGHYDQTLQAYMAKHLYPLTIGLGLLVLHAPTLTSDPHDIPMDYILNEFDFLKF